MNSRPFIVAEMSCNHLGSLERARQLVVAAAGAGVDGFKVQVWSPDTMVLDRSIPAPKPWGGTLFDLYREAWTPWEWLPDLFKQARGLGLVPFGAAFDAESVDYLESLEVPYHKIASNEITDIPLIKKMASTGKRVYLSSGAASIEDLSAAVRVVGHNAFVLACTSEYPADARDAGLNKWAGFGQWGISDHTVGHGVSVAAVALGATYVEKHLTMDRGDGGPDAEFSLEPAEFKELVIACRQAHEATQRCPEQPTRKALRRSLWVRQDTTSGSPLVLGENVCTARPAQGLPPSFDLTGKTASRDLKANTPLTEDCL
jgi:sialic acid synthase SpsE